MPVAALREALLNAIIHRDYAVPSPIQIRVYRDRLLIWNPGELPDGWSREKLLQRHPSKPFNPSLANAFFRAGEIEAWGRGIERIFEVCREAGTPEPRIQVEPGELWFEFPFSAGYVTSLTTEAAGGTAQETGGKTSGKTSGKILAMIRESAEVTIPEMAEATGRSTRAIEMQLEKLKSQGVIRRVGAARGGHWEILEDGDA